MTQAKNVFSCAFAGLLGGIGIGCSAYGLFFIISAYLDQYEITPLGYILLLAGLICMTFAYFSGKKAIKNQISIRIQSLE
ncbi:hypothetical protein PULV_b0541 [Pseudoalteromonas ulvae UL12]|uniref:Uncharacterized protein n=1 Tax=Pseudoalteromonas ulvae TaxID=107327 RepID=A0A244CLQ7_PSEDV|nr:hypothetical protein [Pseudoalteromonas ulvae]MBE0365856.1 hypothetical protein [Pseudoalteromonas ulvae UL12]OUL56547.1 hypothetical protein B1199_17970 [Pseudoalteromonas ulvae]